MPLLPSDTLPTNDMAVLEYAIRHDIEDIADLDEFLADDGEDDVMAMVGNAGCFY